MRADDPNLAPMRVLCEWKLPRTGEPIRLELIKDADGFESPRLNIGNSRKPGDPLELPQADDDFIEEVIEPLLDQLIASYFVKRKRYCRLKPGAKVGARPNKCSLTEAKRRIATDIKKLRHKRKRGKVGKAA